ncbi:MAG: hypothetical protein FD187_650 [bacterium]|nr:MAG: hypothetical protein FD142_907 [bacterium]KAF0150060.1 MAG: hypothetical protein FD187_650 [bacterium]KAF0169168.1 MAG: hypothetical protein FD158_720 [bacterium]TXT17176.1 MAG: hypothetical protein FD132_2534 [bacterium]
MEAGAVLDGLRPLLDWSGLPLDLASLAALAAGLGWASGLRLYALVFTLGALDRFAGVQLPGGLDVLAHPLVLGMSGLLLAVEFLADKIPYVDSLWDSIHTFIRIPAGAALAAAVMVDQGTAMQVAMALLGGSLAAGTHLAKSGVRAAINTSPEPVSNVGASLGEDAVVVGGLWTLFHYPLVFLAGLAVFMLVAMVALFYAWRFVRGLWRGPVRGRFGRGSQNGGHA